MRKILARRIAVIGGLVLFALAFGMVGFMLVAGYSAFDAFYMTVVTISTVGYEEIHPLSPAGRIFNSVLILFGVSVMFFAVGVMTQTIIEIELHDIFGKRRARRMIDRLKDHFIVCGYGRVGRNASAELLRAGAPFVVLDREKGRIDQARQAGMLTLQADATRDESLHAAGIMRAKGLVSALGPDADNLFVILSARALNPKLLLVTRASEDEAAEKLRRAGADTVFAPFSITGQRLAHALLRPLVITFLDSAAMTMGLDVSIEQIQVAPGAEAHAKSLRDLQVGRDLGVIVLAIRKASGQMLFNPPAETKISAGDHLIAMGAAPNLRRLEGVAGQKE
jgi:voltage-gated potassium channel